MHQGATLVFQSSQQANRFVPRCRPPSCADNPCSPGYSWYDLWYPKQSDRYGAPRAAPSYVAYLLVTEAVGSSGKSRIALIDVPSQPQLAVYAIWDDAISHSGPARLAALNLSPRNETTPADEAAQAEVILDISEYVKGGAKNNAAIKRMQAPGLSSKNSTAVTWAGQSYADGKPAGNEMNEKLQSGKITIPGSEGVLVFLR
jgi:hypothetical protein